MNAQLRQHGVPTVELEIDGHPVTAPRGSMIIQAADAAGIPIPRFCYHRKLTIAAVCRQCMVEVEVGGRRIPKPQVACATPVAQGMKVFTKTKLAISAQQNALEFVLINHPLECPICDQGGECELQDLAMGYGRSLSRLNIPKRTVDDENIGPLVATYMTRCIHCIRCVRVLDEIAGTHEFGDFNRADFHVIGTYIGGGVSSELSGNIIDVCPVGALTDKVFEFKARAWELIARPAVGYHDALGSNQWLHCLRNKVLRAVPRNNEAVNECWLADRDRYSHEGLYALDRVSKPLIRRGGALVEVDWADAINFVAEQLQSSAPGVAALVAPMTSCEEGYLLSSIMRGLGSHRCDHRLRVLDFADGGPQGEVFEKPVEQLAHVGAALIIGSNPRHEMPLVNHRLRDAARFDVGKVLVANLADYDTATRHGAKIFAINPIGFEFNFDLAGLSVVAPQHLVERVAQLARAAGASPPHQALTEALASAAPDPRLEQCIAALREADSSVVVLGDAAVQHPQASWLRALARLIARATNSAYDEFPSGANAIGLARVGAQTPDPNGTAASILQDPPESLVTWQAEPEDCANPGAFKRAQEHADFYVHIGAFATEQTLQTAGAILPISLPPETDGTYVNVDGRLQDSVAAAPPLGDARPGWKVLRALGHQLGIDGFDFVDLPQVRERIQGQLHAPAVRHATGQLAAPAAGAKPNDLVRMASVGIYRVDPVVRRATALQAHVLNRPAALRLCAADAQRLTLTDGQGALVEGVHLPVFIDSAVPEGCAWIEAGSHAVTPLPPYGSVVAIEPVAG
ncbi:MAG: NADH dehydrogenase (quinone) subunit G [Rhodanobacteraceae bacterium]|nr:MAG: NADH dehydrogenase (quinone) subunit G [Rhodanobacteraceae bacterium]